ncbi:MAG TPA: penicillin acylase family protein, partial [Puia sp.]|nr:penicillin acylase family protein [Puia sp.]
MERIKSKTIDIRPIASDRACRCLVMMMFLINSTSAQHAGDLARWKSEAAQVTIIRDNWGIPHVYGTTDAEAVFGIIYAECEDD